MSRNHFIEQKRTVPFVALTLWAGLQAGCGSDDASMTGGNGLPARDGGSGGATMTKAYELVQTTDPDVSITQPLQVLVYDLNTGMVLDPPVRVTSEAGSGKFEVTYPRGIWPGIYVVGSSAEQEAPYDSILIQQPEGVFDPRLRMSSVFTAQLVFDSAEIEPRDDAAAVAGTIYWSPNGVRTGVVGCAQVYLDGDTTGLDDVSDQRYVGDNGLPVPAAKQNQTHPVQGSFYFGNLSKGGHRLRAVLNGGATVLGEIDVPIAYARNNALGPSGLVFYTTAFDLDVPENPTPPGCSVD